jgi:NitT/TauT family transport system substrate-binding protein
MHVPRSTVGVALLLALLPLLAVLACAPAPAAAPPPAAPATPRAPAAPAPSAAAGAAAASPAAIAPLNPPVSVKVGTTGLIGAAALFAALENGYFREEGLEVELVPFRGTSEQTAPLATGELAYASVGMDPSFFNAVDRGIPFKIVSYPSIINPRDTSGSWMVRADLVDSNRYREPADLKGMRVAISALGSFTQIMAERVLAKGGLTLDDVELVALSFPDMPAAFANKAIDAAFVVEPFVAVAEGQGSAKTVMPSGQFFFPGTPVLVMAMSPVFAHQEPEAARRFLVAFLRGARDYHRTFMKNEGGRPEFDAILSKYTPIKDAAMFTRMATHDIEPNGVMDATVMNEVQDYFIKYGTQQQKVDLSKVIDSSYADYAVSRLGRVNP